MNHRLAVIGLALVLNILTLLLLAGHGPWAGRELFAISGTHGVNTGDLLVVPLWLVGMASCVWLWRAPSGRQ